MEWFGNKNPQLLKAGGTLAVTFTQFVKKNDYMHDSYEKKLKHPADFRVKYRYYSPEEGGRLNMPDQGIRSDFFYESEKHTVAGNFIIWPEFEDENGNVILDKTIPINKEGTAKMWIILPERREYHTDKIAVGTKGYFMEGNKVAECEVIEIIGLLFNPRS